MPVRLMKENPQSKLICAIFLTPIFVLGLIFVLLWLGLHPHKPKLHIEEFSVPGLGQPNGFTNASITFNVTARNPNRRVRIYYESMEWWVYYKDQQVGSTTPILDSFNQEPENKTTLLQTMTGTMTASTVSNQSWTDFMNDEAQGTVGFSLQLRSIIKYKRSIWDSRRHQMHANCDVGVGSDGLILPSFINKMCHVHIVK